MTTLTMSKRGCVTIPPSIRKRLGLDGVENPLLIVEERGGGVFLQPATAVAVRSFSAEQINGWIKDDETEMAELRRGNRKRGR